MCLELGGHGGGLSGRLESGLAAPCAEDSPGHGVAFLLYRSTVGNAHGLRTVPGRRAESREASEASAAGPLHPRPKRHFTLLGRVPALVMPVPSRVLDLNKCSQLH